MTRESRPGGTEAAPNDLADHLQRNGHHPHALRATLEATGGSLKSTTVLGHKNDPFRLDTAAGHRDGQWLADRIAALRLNGPRHLRGLHYVLIGQPKPNGLPYTNTDRDWTWLSEKAAKAARWLGYVPFDRIVDQRNDAPVIREWSPPNPEPYVWVDFDVVVPGIDDITPLAGVEGFTAAQPYHLVLVGEKSSLRDVLGDVADRYHADLYLPTGEISDTQAYVMARSADQDGRPLVVLYFADCDPSGWQMPVSLSRKLQGLKAIEFDELEFQVHRVTLTPDQVREYGLPSTPLKDTERRADKWTRAMRVWQTEVDALAALRPNLLRDIAEDAVAPFFDATLDTRVRRAMYAWQEQAQQILDEYGGDRLDALRADAAERLADKRQEIQQILDTVRVNAHEFNFPAPVVPEPVIGGEPPEPLCDSWWDFPEQCRALIASKNYQETDG